MAMLYLNIFKILFFDGKNVTNFLDQFSDFYGKYKLFVKKKIKWLPRYCNMQIRQTIEIIKKWRKQDWAKFYDFFKEKYEFANQTQIYYSRNFLKIFKNR